MKPTSPAKARLTLLVLLPFVLGCVNLTKLPAGIAFQGPPRVTDNVEFLLDLTWVDQAGQRHVEQQIFDEVFALIRNANRFVLIDMFLYNDFQGKKPELTRGLSGELTQLLLAQKAELPALQIYLITDPINTVYGGLPSAHFDALRDAGIQVLETDLDKLRDSNPCYSLPWRVLVKPFGNGGGKAMPNPFGRDRVSFRSWLKMLNFKANHRKLVIADDGGAITAIVTSANPHDGSSAHRNAAIKFSGRAALDLFESELAVFDFSGAARPIIDTGAIADGTRGQYQVSILTEERIKHAVLEMVDMTESGDEIDLVMFYLSDRKIIKALKKASGRGVSVRAVLDPNKDAFGWKKNGIPNRQVARELIKHGISLRWCDTHGEQCHGKTLIVRRKDNEMSVLTGSANFTRRNLDNFNLETDVLVTGRLDSALATRVTSYFNRIWHNEEDKRFTVPYDVYKDESKLKPLLYRFQEATGMSTF